jgi:hypothetical protein
MQNAPLGERFFIGPVAILPRKSALPETWSASSSGSNSSGTHFSFAILIGEGGRKFICANEKKSGAWKKSARA